MLRAVAQDERSQWQNRELATARVIDALRAALEVPRRKPTKPTKAAREQRAGKRRRGELKQLRKPPEEQREGDVRDGRKVS